MKSLLFVPCKSKMLSKIESFSSDACIIDLEDSINEADKDTALQLACEFLQTENNRRIYVRLDGNHIKEEVLKLSDLSFSGYMIPKFENPFDYIEFNRYFSEKEIIALVETPLGVTNIRAIAEHDMVDMIAFGAEDFTSAIGMSNCTESLLYARGALVTTGKAFNKPVFDTPSFIIDDTNHLREEIQHAVDMGFDGKLAIHPKQVELINELFSYYDIETIKQVVEQYDSSGEAVLRIGDNIYEKMHIAHFKRILKEQSNLN